LRKAGMGTVDIFYLNNNLYRAQDHVEGQTLEEYVKDREFLETVDIYNIVLNICDIVNYLHNQNPPIVNRGLKPTNIIITPDKKVILIDLGISQIDKTAQADIYSIGIIMYFMVSGKIPCTAFEPLMEENYDGYVDVNLKRIIQKCFQIDIKNRYVSVEELNKEIIIELLKKGKFERLSDSNSSDIKSDIPIKNMRKKRSNRPQWKRSVVAFFARIF
jgi:serine/threonine protein kinase